MKLILGSPEAMHKKVLGALVGLVLSVSYFQVRELIRDAERIVHEPKRVPIVSDPHDEDIFRDWQYFPNYKL